MLRATETVSYGLSRDRHYKHLPSQIDRTQNDSFWEWIAGANAFFGESLKEVSGRLFHALNVGNKQKNYRWQHYLQHGGLFASQNVVNCYCPAISLHGKGTRIIKIHLVVSYHKIPSGSIILCQLWVQNELPRGMDDYIKETIYRLYSLYKRLVHNH